MSTEDFVEACAKPSSGPTRQLVGEIISRWLNLMEDALKPFTVSEDGQ